MNILSSLRKVSAKLRGAIRNPDTAILDQLVPREQQAGWHAHGGSFADHLIATKNILAAWRQAPEIQLAGLCHSIYSTEYFPQQAVSLDGRKKVRLLIGGKAEHLCFLFAATRRQSLFAMLSRYINDPESLDLSEYLEFRTGMSPHSAIHIEDAYSLLIVHLANIAEQGRGKENRGMWLAQFVDLAKLAPHQNVYALSQIVKNGNALTEENEATLGLNYFEGLDCLDDPKISLQCFTDAVAKCEIVAEPYILGAFCNLNMGLIPEALQQLHRAQDLMSYWNTPWDKRFSLSDWHVILKVLFYAAGQRDPKAALASNLILQIARPVSHEVPRAKRNESDLIQYLRLAGSEDRSRSIFPGLRSKELWDPTIFRITTELERAFSVILREALAVCADHPSSFREEAEDIHRSGNWQVLMLHEAGKRNDVNCARVPTVASIVDSHRDVKRLSGLVYLSKLAPRTRISPHKSGTNMRLRCHLPLIVPQGNCGMRVGDQIVKWEVGKCVVFDDYFEHEVWNDTDETRLILLIDLWHPDISGADRQVLSSVSQLVNHQASRLHNYWKVNEGSESPLRPLDD